MKRLATVIGALLVGLVLAGCAPGDPMTGRAGSDLPPGPLQPLPSDTAGPTPHCRTLAVAIGDAKRSSDVELVALQFTNTAKEACFVRGYPALTLKDASNRHVGETARSYVSGGARDLVLAPNETVSADIRFPNPDNFEPGVCKTGTVRLEVLIPGATERAFVDDNHPYCPGWTVSALHRGRSS